MLIYFFIIFIKKYIIVQMSKKIRIGGASGFWGDSVIATPQLLNGNNLDFI